MNTLVIDFETLARQASGSRLTAALRDLDEVLSDPANSADVLNYAMDNRSIVAAELCRRGIVEA